MKLDDKLKSETPTQEEIASQYKFAYNDAKKSISDYQIGNILVGDGSVELIKHDFIATKTVSMLYAASGVGKSSFAYQFAMSLAQGIMTFGMEPTKPIKSLIFQWEDTDKKIQKMVSGIQRELGWDKSIMESIRELVIIPSKKLIAGKSMVETLMIIEEAIKIETPDIVWLNPITAFFDGNISSAQEVTVLRKTIDRLAEQYNVHFLLVHHIAKLGKNSKDGKRFVELDMYDGIGSSIFPNWCRSMMAIHPTTAILPEFPDKQLFCLSITKNAYDLDWRDMTNKRISARYMSYAEKNICWIDHGFDVMTKNDVKKEDVDNDKQMMIIRLQMGKDNAISISELQTHTNRSRQWVTDRLAEIKGTQNLIKVERGKAFVYYIEEEVF